MALREVLIQYDVDGSAASKQLSNLSKEGDKTTNVLQSIGQALAGSAIVGAFQKFISGNIELGSNLKDTSERLGVATDDLQFFQYATGLSGVSAESAGNALKFLSKNSADAAAGSAEAAKVFQSLGVDVKNADGSIRPVTDLLPELSKGFVGLGSDGERTAAAMKIFGRAGLDMVPFLKEGPEGIAKLQAEFGDLGLKLDSDFIEKADVAGDQISKMQLSFRALGSQLAAHILPLVTRASDWFLRLAKGLQTFGKETRIFEYLTPVLIALGAAAGGIAAFQFMKLLGVFDLIIPALTSLGAAFGVGLWPVVLGAVIVGALALVIEDLWTTMRGGNGLLKGLIADTFGVGVASGAIEMFRNAWDSVGPALDQVASAFGRVLELMGFTSNAGVSLSEVAGYIALAFVAAATGIIQAFTFIADAIAGALNRVTDFFNKVEQVRLSARESLLNLVGANTDKGPTLTPSSNAAATAAGAAAAGPVGANINAPQTNNITINANSADAKQVATLTAEKLNGTTGDLRGLAVAGGGQ